MLSQEQRLCSEKIPRLLVSLAVPSICAQIVTLLYNLVDRIYIGRMEDGLLAMAAIGICAPVVTVVTGFTCLLGRGGAPLAAICMGKSDKEGAERFLGNSFSMLCLSSVVITLLVQCFAQPLLILFGASENTLPYAEEYIRIYSLGTLFVQLTVGMNYYITTQGFAKTAMVTTMAGCILNILLDPLLIFTFDMGIQGAALATVLSQFASFVWAVGFLFGRKTILKIRMRNLRPRRDTLRQILVLGSAPFFMKLSEGLLNICFNNQVYRFGGDTAVSAMTILFSIFQFILLPVEGIAQGSQPIIGYNYGAGQYGRVRQTIRLAMLSALTFTVTATTLVMLFPAFFIRIFNSDTELIAVGRDMLRVYVGGLFILGLNSTCQQTYNSMGEGKWAFFFAFFRKIILLIPLIYLLPKLLPWGVRAVVLAEPISDCITTAANALCLRQFIRRKLPRTQPVKTSGT